MTASTIDVPYFKKGGDEQQGVQEIKQSIAEHEEGLSTYTPEKPSQKETKAKKDESAPAPQETSADEDLPF